MICAIVFLKAFIFGFRGAFIGAFNWLSNSYIYAINKALSAITRSLSYYYSTISRALN